MEPELSGLQREFAALDASRVAGFPVEFHFVGVGPRRSARAMNEFLTKAKRKPEGVLMLGVAGAVDPGMESGEVILADTYALDTKEDSAADIPPDPEMLGVAESVASNFEDACSGLTYFKMESERRRSAREQAAKDAIY
ncbi:hypothetical protein GBAR_LOCUS4156 [Geodia barretti]|uniref:Nucleoside phosphorylase domain-containing protein n=1 Tax=Geodia barretti TaxID=519541 RepID=A0AA35R5T1_GEOBA|nr:hypothetical protein GBAR_LOCUS4156 [Geodia barretti]